MNIEQNKKGNSEQFNDRIALVAQRDPLFIDPILNDAYDDELVAVPETPIEFGHRGPGRLSVLVGQENDTETTLPAWTLAAQLLKDGLIIETITQVIPATPSGHWIMTALGFTQANILLADSVVLSGTLESPADTSALKLSLVEHAPAANNDDSALAKQAAGHIIIAAGNAADGDIITLPDGVNTPVLEFDVGVKATGSARLTGDAGAEMATNDIVSASESGLRFKASETKAIPEGTVPVVVDADTNVLAAVGHGLANTTKGRLSAEEVAAVKATGSVRVTAAGATVIAAGSVFSDGANQFKTDAEATVPDGPVSVVADPDTEKFAAVGHGLADDTVGQFTAEEVAAVAATGSARLTGAGGSVIAIDDKVLAGAVEFKATEEVTVPLEILPVVADSDTEKFTAAAHGMADDSVGQFTADYVNAATGEVVLTGASESEILEDDEVSASGDTPIVFKATEGKAFPADGIAVTADNTTNKFRHDGHVYAIGSKGQFTGVTLPSGIAASTDYYIVWTDGDYFQVSLTEGGPVDTFSTDGDTVVFTASVRKMVVAVEAVLAGPSGNVDAGAIDTLSAGLSGEGFTAVTNPEAFTDADDEMDLPNGILPDTDYHIVNRGVNDFQVSLTEGGDAVEFSTNGTGVVFTASAVKVDVAIAAVVAGAAGNVDAEAITTLSAEVIAKGFTAVINPAATENGADAYQLLPTGILPDTDYYMVSRAADEFKVSLTEGGDAVEFSTAGTTVVFTPTVRKVDVAITAVVAGAAGNVDAETIDTIPTPIAGVTAVINPAATENGADAYQLLPTGITPTTDVYIRDRATDSFKLALTEGGTAIDFSDTGTNVVFNPITRKIDVAVIAEEYGDAYNLDAAAIDTLSDDLTTEGFTAVTNPSATSGGVDAGGAVTPGRTPVAIGSSNLVTIQNLHAAIEALEESGDLNMLGIDLGTGRLNLLNTIPGAAGNQPITKTGDNITVSGMTGGAEAVDVRGIYDAIKDIEINIDELNVDVDALGEKTDPPVSGDAEEDSTARGLVALGKRTVNRLISIGSALLGIKTGTDKIPAQGQALAAASTPVVLPALMVTDLKAVTEASAADIKTAVEASQVIDAAEHNGVAGSKNVGVTNPPWTRVSGPTSMGAAVSFVTTTWTDLGAEIAVTGYNKIRFYLTVDINDTTGAAFRIMLKDVSAAADEYVYKFFTVAAGVVTCDDASWTLGDADGYVEIDISDIGNTVAYVQAQIYCGAQGAAPGNVTGKYMLAY